MGLPGETIQWSGPCWKTYYRPDACGLQNRLIELDDGDESSVAQEAAALVRILFHR